MKKMGLIQKFLRILAITTGILFVLLLMALASTTLWLARIVNPILSRELGTEACIENVRLHLHRGYAEIHHIHIAQPPGFENAPPLLTVSHPRIQIRLLPLLKGQIDIPDISIAYVELHIIRNKEGRSNLQALADARPVKDRPPKEPKPPRETYPSVGLSNFTMAEVFITYSDFSISPPVLLALTNLHVQASNLQFDPQIARTSKTMPGRIRVEATLQQSRYENGYVGVKTALGVTSTNIPPINAAVRIIGFDIRSIRGLLPPGISTTIGGSNMDVIIDAAIAEDYLLVQNRLQTAGNTYRLNISGTPQNPNIDRSTALFNLITRPGAFLTTTAGGVADAGFAAGKTVTSTATRAGSGIFQNIVNIGRGATRTASSAARGDIRGIGNGMVDMTYGTVTGALNTVTTTVRGVGAGIGDTFSAASGRTQTRDWEATNHRRWEQQWERALHFANFAPYPGTVPLPPATPDQTNTPTRKPSAKIPDPGSATETE